MVSDLTVIRSIAVSAEDLAVAAELISTSGADAVLRITPQFSGRMWARIHAGDRDDAGNPAPVYVPPARLLAPSAPDIARPPETADRLRADPKETYSVERHREYHAAALADWRRELLGAVSDRATIDTPAGKTTVTVAVLDDPDDPDGPAAAGERERTSALDKMFPWRNAGLSPLEHAGCVGKTS